LPLKLLIDESVDYRIVKKIKAFDVEINSVAELSGGSRAMRFWNCQDNTTQFY